MARALVAGMGNIFLSDDGFGSAVVARLADRSLPPDVEVTDAGIRGLHLAYRLLDGYEQLVLVDALPAGHAPGTVYVLEPDAADLAALPPSPPDGHALDPRAVLRLLPNMGGHVSRCLVVGCEPATVAEGMGLSPPVAAAVDAAADVVVRLVTTTAAAATEGA